MKSEKKIENAHSQGSGLNVIKLDLCCIGSIKCCGTSSALPIIMLQEQHFSQEPEEVISIYYIDFAAS